MLRKGKKEEGKSLADDVRARVGALREQARVALDGQQWDQVDRTLIETVQLLRETSLVVPPTQSQLAELHSRWGLALTGARRYEEAYKHLYTAQQLFNMDPAEAAEWASGQHIVMQGEGEGLDLALALDVLNVLADNTMRLGRSGADEVLYQAVDVARMLGDAEGQWTTRQRLADYLVSQNEWAELLEVGRKLVALAHEQRRLPWLFDAMSAITEALVGLGRLGDAVEAQDLVVETARFLQHRSLPDAEQELARLRRAA